MKTEKEPLKSEYEQTEDEEITIISDTIQSSNTDWKFKCFCGKLYLTKQNLQRHTEVIHQGVRFKCDECAKEFTDERNLHRHQNVKHNNHKHKCPNCTQTQDPST